MWNIYFELLNFVCEKNIVTKKFGIICCLLKNHLIELFEQGICKLLLYNISKATYQKAYLDTTFRFEQASAWNASFLVDHITYIIGHSVRFIDLVSYTAYVVCVNFIHKWRDLQFNVDSERKIFWRKLSWQFYLILWVFVRNLLGGNRRRNTFRILFWCLAWASNPSFSSNKPTHYLLHHADFNLIKTL